MTDFNDLSLLFCQSRCGCVELVALLKGPAFPLSCVLSFVICVISFLPV